MNLTVYLDNGRWKYSEGDYFYDYAATVGEEAETAWQKRWKREFPMPAPDEPVTADSSMLHGVWRFDGIATLRVLTKLRVSKRKVNEVLRDMKGFGYSFSQRKYEMLKGGKAFSGSAILKWERQGNLFIACLEGGFASGYWSDGERMVPVMRETVYSRAKGH